MLAFGGWLALHGRITLGTFLAFSSYLVQLVAPVRMFAVLIAVGQQARAGAERILELLDSNPLVVSSARRRRPAAGAPARSHFDDVRFGYLRVRARARRLHLHVAPGRDRRPGGRQRLGQVDRRAAAAPLLRRRRRAR